MDSIRKHYAGSVVAQNQKDKYCMFSLTYGFYLCIFRFVFLTWRTCRIQEKRGSMMGKGKKILKEEEY